MGWQELIIMESTKKEAIKRARKDYPNAVYSKVYKRSSKGNSFYLFVNHVK